jgi:hypothetical protein
MRVDMSIGAHRYAVCVASYGYMGDLMRTSERLRFLGPARYGLAGAWTLLRGASYEAQVRVSVAVLCAHTGLRQLRKARMPSLCVLCLCCSWS